MPYAPQGVKGTDDDDCLLEVMNCGTSSLQPWAVSGQNMEK
jgi:hypothetical protein